MPDVVYNRVNWVNKPSTDTPVNATNLNKMDKGISDCANQINSLNQSDSQKNTDITSIKNNIGTLSNLSTTAKNNLVAAINEVLGKVGSMSAVKKIQHVTQSVTVQPGTSSYISVGLSGFTNASKMCVTSVYLTDASWVHVSGGITLTTSSFVLPVHHGASDRTAETVTCDAWIVEYT